MTVSAGYTPAASNRRNDERREEPPVPHTEILVRDTHKVLAAAGASRSASWVDRTVRAYGRRGAPLGVPFGVFLAVQLQMNAERRETIARNHPELAYLMVYADPTGEAAVRRVMRCSR